MNLLINRAALEERIKNDQRLGESELKLVSEESFPAFLRVVQLLTRKDVEVDPTTDAEKEIALLRKYCSAAASDYERSLDRLIEAGKAHDIDLLKEFASVAQETKESSEFLRMASEGRIDNTIYEDELTKAHQDKDAIRDERDRLAERLRVVDASLARISEEMARCSQALDKAVEHV